LRIDKQKRNGFRHSSTHSITSGDEVSILAGEADELRREQEYVSALYARLDALRADAGAQLATALRHTGGTPQARTEREALIARHTDRITELDAVEHGLCFGRLDHHDGERRYIGRIGLFDDSGDYEPLLLDWRAPAARPFYLATAAAPDGVRTRRHLETRLRRVVGIHDEVLDLDAERATTHDELTGEAALLAALNAGRTGRMRDIVETIQAEQDRIIRSGLEGVLVVQGGAGTGKTAVALHRAAYLLYTHRRHLESAGVLVVGPNPVFLRYIAHVLPSLAETGVLLGTMGDLYPGIRAHGPEQPEVAEVKGRAGMVDVLAAAVADRQEVPDDVLEIPFDQDVLRLDPETCRRARERARRSEKPHNLARPVFARRLVAALVGQLADRIGTDPYADDPLGGDDAPGDSQLLDEADLTDIRAELETDENVQAVLDALWPVLTPEQLLADLFASAERIATAAPELTEQERQLLWRDAGAAWTPADVPLLDEVAELLGTTNRADRALAEQRHREELEYAQGALDIALGSRSMEFEDETESEVLDVTDLLDADRLAERQEEIERRTVAQRAAVDRTWTFGHVIVDEAQELSPMAWRLLMRRCPSRSMTVVGDVAQTGALGGATSWREALEPHVGGRWRLTELTVCYRTPAEIMAVAADVLTELDPDLTVPGSVRTAGVAPWALRVGPAELVEEVVTAARREAAELGEGRLGVIVPAGSIEEVGRAVADAVPGTAVGEAPELENPVVVVTVRQAKGLEFDSVLVIDPERILAESPRGYSDLYVALTRATQRLGILAPGALPPVLSGVQLAGQRSPAGGTARASR
jgi:DNA helicase IV